MNKETFKRCYDKAVKAAFCRVTYLGLWRQFEVVQVNDSDPLFVNEYLLVVGGYIRWAKDCEARAIEEDLDKDGHLPQYKGGQMKVKQLG